ncbi:MAG: type II toxin-antitoxin system RelE/ParE family toxin [Phycisphaerae bacterium]
MGQVTWAPAAIEDAEAIAQYIARDSVDQAALTVLRLLEATDRLQEFPLCGRVIPELGAPSCREILVGAYRIMYGLRGEDVWITGVIHGARDWPRTAVRPGPIPEGGEP